MLLSSSLFGQLPGLRELEAESFAQEVYKAFGSPTSKDLERVVGIENFILLLDGIREGHFSVDEASVALVELLKERGTLPQGTFLPSVVARGLTSTEPSQPIVSYEEPFPSIEPTSTGIILSAPENPLIRLPSAQPQQQANATVTLSNETPTIPQPATNATIVPSSAERPAPSQPQRDYTEQDFLKRVGPIGVVTSGGSRGQRPPEVFSGQQLLDGAKSLMRQGGRLPTDNRTSPGIAAIQLMLLGAGFDLGEEGLDAFGNITNPTAAVLQQFQRQEGLTPDGQLTAATWQALLNRFLRPRSP